MNNLAPMNNCPDGYFSTEEYNIRFNYRTSPPEQEKQYVCIGFLSKFEYWFRSP